MFPVLSSAPFLEFTTAQAMRDIDEPFRIDYDDVRKVRRKYRRREVAFPTQEPPGTIIIDPASKYLYFILGDGRATRYGVGVGRQGFEWSGEAVVRRKAKWPRWTPPKEMVERDELARKWANGMPGGPQNPLGARALYLFQGNVDTLYRIHGTFQPETIGTAVSSGCIRLINADVADLYERVSIGAKVIVFGAPLEIVEEKPQMASIQSRSLEGKTSR
jgi:lipoprotein-anchoring transpeptidase ErfK/SrfK